MERRQKKIKKYIIEEWREDQKSEKKIRRVERRLEEWKEDKR